MSDLSSSLHPRQKGRSQNPSSLANIKTLVTLGMLTALAYAVMAVCKVIPAVGGFLSFDLKDTVMAIGGFLFGPAAALAMAIVVPFIEFVTVSDTGWYGLIMNIIATTLFVLPAVLIYRRRHKTSAAILGLVVGVVCLTLGMILWNYIITPFYFQMKRALVLDMMPMIIAFNLVKGVCNAALIMVTYPPVSAALRKTGLVAPSRNLPAGEKRKFNFVPTVVSALVLLTGVLFLLALLGVI